MVKAIIPKDIDEALQFMEKTEVYVVAGGTDLMVKKKGWSGVAPYFDKPIIFIKYLNELKEIKLEKNILKIGAGCTFKDIVDSDKTSQYLKEVSLNIASPAIRNIATIGGNICNASPAADILPPLYAVRAEVVLESTDGKRNVPIEDFILGPRKINIKKGELLKEIIIPTIKCSKFYYKKIGTRKSIALSKLSFFGFANVESKKIEDIKLAFGAVGPTVVISKDIENSLKGIPIDEIQNIVKSIKEEYSKLLNPIDDQRSTAEYRRNIALNLLEDFLLNII
ncbi:xanthine dehydrogenase FAD-binding subunit XdhB [Clostridium polyendosporum]|uniref:Xanthine dehydrogenase FAD-binding subunit XdhB n=1 Tax=Clostridium polyendosporum TaxID=69208 RepID=A0A919S0P7_9CLOT|nr:xanthine dehydrogenase family protein subunit M [Clostridium polyendosporum]GIM29269.1 xanthine dehydrogenase FAD-binding subunit XdhB [Clostridium polyendosporum]